MAPAAMFTVAGETLAMVPSALARVMVRAAGAGAEREMFRGIDAPIATVLVAGATTFPALWTVTVVVVSAMNGFWPAWITAVPRATEVMGTMALVVVGGKLIGDGTVATDGVAELRVTIRPPAGAGAERFNVTFRVVIPVIVTEGCEKLRVAVEFTVPEPGVYPVADAVTVTLPRLTPVTCGCVVGVVAPFGTTNGPAETCTFEGSALATVKVVSAGAGADKDTASVTDWPSDTAVVAGT